MKHCLLFLLVLVNISCQGQQQKNRKEKGRVKMPQNATHAGNLNVDLSSAKKVTLDFNGYNTANTFANADVDDAGFRQLVSSLHPDVLRFPGGSIANYYHLDGKGYGFRESEVNLSDGNVAKHVESMVKKNNNADTKTNYIEDFVKLAEATHADVLVVANVISGTPQEMIQLVNYFQSRKLKVRGIELGNELYLKAYKDIFPTSEEYIRKVMPFVQAARQNFKEIPLGVPVDLRGIGKDKADEIWNGALSRQNFYDAAVIHIYADEPECNDGDIAQQFGCSAQSLQNYCDRNLPNQLNKCAAQFDGKRFWITEWNLRKPEEKLGGTLLQGLYIAQFILKVNRWNTNNNRIDLMTFHNLSSNESGYGMINPSANGYTVNPAYYTMLMFAGAAGNNMNYAFAQAGSATAGVFVNTDGRKAEGYIVNLGSEPIPFNSVTFTQKGNAATVSAYEQFTGEALYAATTTAGYEGKNIAARNGNPAGARSIRNSKMQQGKPQQYAPYSLTHVRIDLQP